MTQYFQTFFICAPVEKITTKNLDLLNIQSHHSVCVVLDLSFLKLSFISFHFFLSSKIRVDVRFCANEQVKALLAIGRGELPKIPDILSLDARDFIAKCLKVNPEERPTAAELLKHPFVEWPLASSGS